MNPRTFDLIYYRVEKDNPELDSLLGEIEKMGFAVREASLDDLDSQMISLPIEARFCSKEVMLAGGENLFVPKPEYRERVLSSLRAGSN